MHTAAAAAAAVAACAAAPSPRAARARARRCGCAPRALLPPLRALPTADDDAYDDAARARSRWAGAPPPRASDAPPRARAARRAAPRRGSGEPSLRNGRWANDDAAADDGAAPDEWRQARGWAFPPRGDDDDGEEDESGNGFARAPRARRGAAPAPDDGADGPPFSGAHCTHTHMRERVLSASRAAIRAQSLRRRWCWRRFR
jgi:hypothetical protein